MGFRSRLAALGLSARARRSRSRPRRRRAGRAISVAWGFPFRSAIPRIVQDGAELLEAMNNSTDILQIACLDKPDEFVPLGVRKPDGIWTLADPDTRIGYSALGAMLAFWSG